MAPDQSPVVLVVEDEPFILMAAADALSDGGYVVLEAQDASEALSIAARSSRVDLLFTDINLPGGMDGLELAEIVVGRMPSIKLVVTSGHRCVADADLPDGGVFLAKPYRPDQVRRLMSTQLAR